MAAALFSIARENIDDWGAGVSRTAMNRHVFSASRRWLVDWMMLIWWEVSIEAGEVDDPAARFAKLRALCAGNIIHIT